MNKFDPNTIIRKYLFLVPLLLLIFLFYIFLSRRANILTRPNVDIPTANNITKHDYFVPSRISENHLTGKYSEISPDHSNPHIDNTLSSHISKDTIVCKTIDDAWTINVKSSINTLSIKDSGNIIAFCTKGISLIHPVQGRVGARVIIYNFINSSNLGEYTGDISSVNDVCFLANTDMLVSGGSEGKVTLYDYNKNQIINSYNSQRGIWRISARGDGKRIAIMDISGDINVLKVPEMISIYNINSYVYGKDSHMVYSRNNDMIYIAGGEGYVWELNPEIKNITKKSENRYYESLLWVSDDGGLVVGKNHDGPIAYKTLNNSISNIIAEGNYRLSVEHIFKTENRLIAWRGITGGDSNENGIYIWDTNDGIKNIKERELIRMPTAMDVTYDGKIIAAEKEGDIVIWKCGKASGGVFR